MRAAIEAAPMEVWQDVIRLYPDYKIWVVLNKAVPHEILDLLAGDVDSRIRETVASKRKASAALLQRLGSDASDEVRASVARNRSTPKALLEDLARDPVPWVAQRAAETLRMG